MKNSKNRIMWCFESFFYKLITLVVCLLSHIHRKHSIQIGNMLGDIWFLIDKKHRMIALDNLSHAFRNEKKRYEIKKIARKVFQNLAQIPFEIAWSQRLGRNDFSEYFDIIGLSNIKAALEKGKGLLILGAHSGNWELLSIPLLLAGYPLNVVYRPLDFKQADRFICKYRARFGTGLIPKKHSMLKIIRCLQQNEMVAILLDQDSGLTAGVFVDFFGRKACTNKGLALIALKTEAPIIPVYIIRDKMKFRAVFENEIPLIKTGNKTNDVEANTQQYNNIIEGFIRRYPDQWFWIHRRWKNRPQTKPGTEEYAGK